MKRMAVPASLLVVSAVLSGCSAAGSTAVPTGGVTSVMATEGEKLTPDSAGNYLTEREARVRETMISICTTGDDADDVRDFWGYEDQPLTFDEVFQQALDGKPATDTTPRVPSEVLSWTDGMEHVLGMTESCADIVSMLPYYADIVELDAAMEKRRQDGIPNPDFYSLHAITFPILNGEVEAPE